MVSTRSFDISPSTSVANARLNVYSVEKSLHFYRDLLGFQIIGKSSEDNALLAPIDSNNKNHLLQLSRVDTSHRVIEGEQSPIRQAGLYHFSLNLRSKENIEELLSQLRRMGIEQIRDDSNKINKESFFILDPDKIKIQIYNQ